MNKTCVKFTIEILTKKTSVTNIIISLHSEQLLIFIIHYDTYKELITVIYTEHQDMWHYNMLSSHFHPYFLDKNYTTDIYL